MDRISTSTAVAQMPAVTDDGTPGFFAGGNPSAGTPATFVSADFLNGMQEELVGVITAAGLTPSKTNLTQLLAAMKKLFVRLGSDADAALGIGLDATDGLPHAYASGVDRGAFCLMSAFAGGLAARGETGTWVLPDGHIMQVFPTPTFTIEQANTPQPYKFTYPTAFPRLRTH
ncbi:hypothetical protein D3W54_15435 [Komagataeibacter medellinensis]|uniref:Uncharacterized protein n=1 Tax=Komagataeibacter medellinensis TaxID=1177712 RepID=A0ABQ6VRT7_9PROT|nr:hypothetical protein [Komagataeibacter medellinensis]KAB8122562.1 hypothetical protein D3W54_15435 [Komagataeibacter medellinensis]